MGRRTELPSTARMISEPKRTFIRSYEDLDVYQRAMALIKPVHEAALQLPAYEQYDLASQIRRACKSIPTNIAEGYGRKRSAKEFQKFLSIALGSTTELEVHLKIALALAERLIAECQIVGKQIYRLMQHWRTIETSPPNSHLPGATQ